MSVRRYSTVSVFRVGKYIGSSMLGDGRTTVLFVIDQEFFCTVVVNSVSSKIEMNY